MHNKKKIYYVTNIRLPTEKAHGIQIMKMCEAFSSNGNDVELVIPDRISHIKESPYEYYNIQPVFGIKRLKCLNITGTSSVVYYIQALTFASTSLYYALTKKDLFLTRDKLIAIVLRIIGKRVIWEGHVGDVNLLTRILVFLRVPFVVITHALKELYINMGVSEKLIQVAPDGVDMSQFNLDISKIDARRKLGIESLGKIILYTGHLYAWKGVDTLAQAAKMLDERVSVYILGGTVSEVQSLRSRFSDVTNLNIIGKKPYSEMPLYMKTADVLVLPNSSREDVSRLYTSPMKLFEYMASKRPIVASDLPSIKEILSSKEAYFFKPDDPDNLAQVLSEVLENEEEAKQKSDLAFEKVKQFTWRSRAKKISDFIISVY